MDKEVGALRFPRAALARDDDGLVDVLLQHGVEGRVRDSEHVRWQLSQLVVSVQLDVFGVVDGQELEGIYGDEDVAGVRVDLLLVEAVAQGVQDARLCQDG